LIFTLPVDSEEDLIACFIEAAATIRQQPGIFESQVNLLHHCWLRIEIGGCIFEHLF